MPNPDPKLGPKLLSHLWQLLFSKLRRHLWFAGDLLPNWPFGLGSAEVHLLSDRPRQRPLGRRKLRPRLDFDDRYLRTLDQKGQVDYRMIGNSERKKKHRYVVKLGEILVNFRFTSVAFSGTVESRIDVRQGINIGHCKFGEKNKRRVLNKCRA